MIGRDWPGSDEAPDPYSENVSEPVFRRSWRPVDLTTVLDGSYAPPEPTVGKREDGVGLLYPGRCHTIASESEAGKTWFCLSMVLDEMAAGNDVVYIDGEDDEGGITGRLIGLGADRTKIRDHFHYIRPEDPIGSGTHRDDLDQAMRDTRPTLAVLDGVTELLTMHGLDPNSNADVAKFGRMVPRRVAEFGAATVSLDHVPKSTENRGRYSIGAVHKLNALNGAAYVLENRTPFGVGMTGRSTLRVAKDRPGQIRRHALPHSSGLAWMGDLVLTSHSVDFAEVEVAAPHERDENFRPTKYMGRIMDAIESNGPLSKRMIRTAVVGKSMTVDAALDHLILEGYLTEKSPHTKVKDWAVDAA